MLKNKYEKWLIIIFCIIFIIISVLTGIIAENEIHTRHCDDLHCSICALIYISTDFVRNIGIIDFNTLIVIITSIIIFLKVKNIETIKRQTLVDLKVIQNN